MTALYERRPSGSTAWRFDLAQSRIPTTTLHLLIKKAAQQSQKQPEHARTCDGKHSKAVNELFWDNVLP